MKTGGPFETSMDRTVARRIVLVQADVDGSDWLGRMCCWRNTLLQPETA